MKRLLVTGSRDWTDYNRLEDEMFRALEDLGGPAAKIVVVHGGAMGADMMADTMAHFYNLQIEEHPVEWRPYGIYNPQAGRYRNQVMVDMGADLCLAFIRNNSRGATHCAQAAEDAGIPVRIFRE